MYKLQLVKGKKLQISIELLRIDLRVTVSRITKLRGPKQILVHG